MMLSSVTSTPLGPGPFVTPGAPFGPTNPVTRATNRSFTALRAKGVDESDRKCVLVGAKTIVFQIERDIGVIVPVLEPRNDAIFVFEFAGDGEFLHLLCGAARETLLVVIVLPSGGEREPIIGLKLPVPSHALPSNRSAAFLIPTVVVISSQTELGREAVRCDRIRHVPRIRGVGYLWSADIGFRGRQLRYRLHGHLTDDGFLINQCHCIVPTIDD